MFFSDWTTISRAIVSRILLPRTCCCDVDFEPTVIMQSHSKGRSCRSCEAVVVDGM